jgi:hypothetical protein
LREALVPDQARSIAGFIHRPAKRQGGRFRQRRRQFGEGAAWQTGLVRLREKLLPALLACLQFQC